MTVPERQIIELLSQILAELQRLTKYARRAEKRAGKSAIAASESDVDEA